MDRLRSSVFVLVLLGLALVLSWPALRWLWGEWLASPYYGHGLLVLPLSVYLGWRRIDSYRSADTLTGESRGLLLLLLSVSAFLFLLDFRIYYLACFATIGMIAGLVWTFWGFGALSQLVFPFAFLALAVPLPFVERATLPLALWMGSCSTSLASWAGLDLIVNGNAISLPNAELIIGPQCSGMSSIIALTAMTSLLAYLLTGPVWGRMALFLLAIPLAGLGNILRVTNLLFVARYWGAEMAFRYYHDFSGPLFFLIALLLLLPLSRLFQCRQLRFERF